MSVQCVTCTNFSLKTAGKMATHGFGHCKHQQPHQFHSATFSRTCDKHQLADSDVSKARVQWLQSR